MRDRDQSAAQREAEAARRRAQFTQTKQDGLSRKIKVRLIAVGVVVLFAVIGAATNSQGMGIATGLAAIVAWFAWRAVR